MQPEIGPAKRDSRIITGDLRMTKRGWSLTIRETRLGFGETGTRAPGGGLSSHSWGVGRSLPGPALMPGRRSGRAWFASPLSPPQSLVHEASRCWASAGWLKAGGLKPPPRETPLRDRPAFKWLVAQ